MYVDKNNILNSSQSYLYKECERQKNFAILLSVYTKLGKFLVNFGNIWYTLGIIAPFLAIVNP
jgi:hypothetical protein